MTGGFAAIAARRMKVAKYEASRENASDIFDRLAGEYELSPRQWTAKKEKRVIPNRKVSTAALSGAISVIVVWALGKYGLTVDPQESSAITFVLMTLVGWWVPLPADPPPDENTP